MGKRTNKEFQDYNDYHDRPFGLKWGTAFALDELVKVIDQNKKEANVNIKELPLMTRSQLDKTLQYAFLKTLRISVQLNSRDIHGNLKESIVGKFEGLADEEYLQVEKVSIRWESIRNIQVIQN